jgi:hypothetical protein
LFQGRKPALKQFAEGTKVEAAVQFGIGLEIGPGELQQGNRGSVAIVLEMDEGAGYLNKPFVECSIRGLAGG